MLNSETTTCGVVFYHLEFELFHLTHVKVVGFWCPFDGPSARMHSCRWTQTQFINRNWVKYWIVSQVRVVQQRCFALHLIKCRSSRVKLLPPQFVMHWVCSRCLSVLQTIVHSAYERICNANVG